MRVVVAADKFKGSLSAVGVCTALGDGLRLGAPGAEIAIRPVADGGEGTLDAAVAAGFDRVAVTVSGPTGRPVPTAYARRGDLAVVELAATCGAALLPDGRPQPMSASTFGLGQAMRTALAAGARRMIVGIGGSASTDGGIGMLQALGLRTFRADGSALVRPSVGLAGRDLADAARLDLSGLDPRLFAASLTFAADVDNPLLGPRGAADVYGPQKGATPGEVDRLEAGLRNWAGLLAAATGADRSAEPGSGAAGGVGVAAVAVLGARLTSGIDVVLDLVGLRSALAGAVLVVTGEGSLDEQTLSGKAPLGVARAATRDGVPVVAVAGRSTLGPGQLRAAGFADCYRLTDLEPDPRRSVAEAAPLLRRIGARVAAEHLSACGVPTTAQRRRPRRK